MRDAWCVRTTLDIADDVLQAARQLAANRKSSVGKVLSELARQGLEPRRKLRVRNGVPVLTARPRGARKPTLDVVNTLRDELP